MPSNKFEWAELFLGIVATVGTDIDLIITLVSLLSRNDGIAVSIYGRPASGSWSHAPATFAASREQEVLDESSYRFICSVI